MPKVWLIIPKTINIMFRKNLEYKKWAVFRIFELVLRTERLSSSFELFLCHDSSWLNKKAMLNWTRRLIGAVITRRLVGCQNANIEMDKKGKPIHENTIYSSLVYFRLSREMDVEMKKSLTWYGSFHSFTRQWWLVFDYYFCTMMNFSIFFCFLK